MGIWKKIKELFNLTPELKLGEDTQPKQVEEPKEE